MPVRGSALLEEQMMPRTRRGCLQQVMVGFRSRGTLQEVMPVGSGALLKKQMMPR